MRCPTLEELPLPPEDKHGFPWTEASPDASTARSSGAPWSKVGVVTPSYNQSQFLEETLRSVLLQGYPDLEYGVVDGGSTDGSVEIIRKYAPWLSFWVSEPDNGQTHAINKGLARLSGNVVAWLNSDDVYEPGALANAVAKLTVSPGTAAVYGEANFIGAAGETLSRFRTREWRAPEMFFDHFIPQPTVFMRRQALERASGLDETLHFCMDYDLWLRLSLVGQIQHVRQLWARFRIHPASKGSMLQAQRWAETANILATFLGREDVPNKWRQTRVEACGRAHWRASIEFWRSQKKDEAREHIQQASQFAPSYPDTREFAGFLVGGLAHETTEEMLGLVADYNDLIPDQSTVKQRAFVRARAFAEALVALNDATPRHAARHHARNALRLDQYWLTNRHVVSRAL